MKIKSFVVVFLATLFVFSTPSFARGHGGHHNSYVRGYYRSNGTYVQGHHRSARDGNVYNNWTTKGNTNPYTGKEGTREPY